VQTAQRERFAADSWQYLVTKAGGQSAIGWVIATSTHGRELDRRKRPYIQHPLGVAKSILEEWNSGGLTPEVLGRSDIGIDGLFAVGLDHDVPEAEADRAHHPHKQLAAQASLDRMALMGLHPPVVELIGAMTYVALPGIGAQQKIEEQAANLLAVPGAPKLKRHDFRNNVDRLRLYPYLNAPDTVHSVWKIHHLSQAIGEHPHGMPNGLWDLPPEVLALPKVRDILEGEVPLGQPPRKNTDLMNTLESYPVLELPRVRHIAG
jgi:hypothetical protein